MRTAVSKSPNAYLKGRLDCLDQALLWRGSRDFADLDACRGFVARVCERHNGRRRALVAAERETLHALPKYRTTDFATITALVSRNCTISVDRVF